MAAVLLFDPLKFSKRLINVGMPPAQAEELAEAQKESLEESMNSRIASKEDIGRLKEDIIRLDKKIDDSNNELKSIIQKIHGKLNTHAWMLRFLLFFIVSIFYKLFF